MGRISNTEILQEHYLRRLAQSISPHCYCWLSTVDSLIVAGRGSNFISLRLEDDQVPPYFSTPIGISIAQQLSKHLPIGEIYEIGFMLTESYTFAHPVGKHTILSVETYSDVNWEHIVEQLEIFSLELLEFIPLIGWFND